MKTTLAVSCVALALALGGAFAAFRLGRPSPASRHRQAKPIGIDAPAPDPATFDEGAPTLIVAARRAPRPDQVVLFWEAPMVTVKARRPAPAQLAKAGRQPHAGP